MSLISFFISFFLRLFGPENNSAPYEGLAPVAAELEHRQAAPHTLATRANKVNYGRAARIYVYVNTKRERTTDKEKGRHVDRERDTQTGTDGLKKREIGRNREIDYGGWEDNRERESERDR